MIIFHTQKYYNRLEQVITIQCIFLTAYPEWIQGCIKYFILLCFNDEGSIELVVGWGTSMK
jgi:hypothetical protein